MTDHNAHDTDDAPDAVTTFTAADLFAAMRAAGIPTTGWVVDQTGGGTATIYGGPTRPHPEYPDEYPTVCAYAVVIGPGTYDYAHPSRSEFSTWETSVGADDADADTFGPEPGADVTEALPVYVAGIRSLLTAAGVTL